MSQTPITVNYTLEQILTKLDQRLDKIENKIDNLDSKFTAKIDNLDSKLTTEIKNLDSKLTTKIENLDQKVDHLNVEVVTVKTKVESLFNDVKDLKTTQKNQIWSLIALAFTAVVGLLGTFATVAVRLFSVKLP